MTIGYIFQYYNWVFGWILLKVININIIGTNCIKNKASTSRRLLKYGLHAESTILCALQVCPSQARVTSVKLFSSLKCRNEDTILLWKSFHLRKNCCWSAIFQIWQSKIKKQATLPNQCFQLHNLIGLKSKILLTWIKTVHSYNMESSYESSLFLI